MRKSRQTFGLGLTTSGLGVTTSGLGVTTSGLGVSDFGIVSAAFNGVLLSDFASVLAIFVGDSPPLGAPASPSCFLFNPFLPTMRAILPSLEDTSKCFKAQVSLSGHQARILNPQTPGWSSTLVSSAGASGVLKTRCSLLGVFARFLPALAGVLAVPAFSASFLVCSAELDCKPSEVVTGVEFLGEKM